MPIVRGDVKENSKLEVINYWTQDVKPALRKELERLVDEIQRESGIDFRENIATGNKIKHLLRKIESGHIIRWCSVIATGVLVGICIFLISLVKDVGVNILSIISLVICGMLLVASLLWFFSNLKSKDMLEEEVELQKINGYRQLKPINSKITTTFFYDVFNKIYKSISFDPVMLQDTMDVWSDYWQDLLSESVVYYTSGEIFSNPFILYHSIALGEQTNHYDVDTRVYRNGQSFPKHVHFEHKVPAFIKQSRLLLLTSAAPELKFSNFYALNNGKGKQFSKKVKDWMHYRKGQYEVDNPTFERVFPTTRNSESKFRLLYTPLAQEQTIKLLEHFHDYGIAKDGEMNLVEADSLTQIGFSVAPPSVWDYDIRRWKENVLQKGMNFFTVLYFMLAPLICIPLNQQYQFQVTHKRQHAGVASILNSQAVLCNYFDKQHLVDEKTNTKWIYQVRKMSVGQNFEIDEVTSISFFCYDHTIGVEGVPIKIKDYKPLKKVTFLVNILNVFEVKEHHISNTEFVAIKELFHSAEVMQVCMNDTLIYILCNKPNINLEPQTLKELALILKGKVTLR